MSRMGRLDALFLGFSCLAAVWLAYLLLKDGLQPGWPWLLLLVFWLFLSYLLLPRLHRILTRIYIPGYFIGRTRTSDGLLGDPVNVALLGREAQLHRALTGSGWVRADEIDLSSTRQIISATLRGRSYATAPVSPLYLFDRPQDFAYQQEVSGSPSRRHHIRFWRCPPGWTLPGGYAVDWLAAGTYDRSVGFSLFTLQITHKIEQHTDVERDFVVNTVTSANPSVEVRLVEDFSSGYHSRNGGGDCIQTDGDLPIVDLTTVRAPSRHDTSPTDSRRRRPAQTLFGGVLTLFRAVTLGAAAVVVVAYPAYFSFMTYNLGIRVPRPDVDLAQWVTAAGLIVAAGVDVVLGWGVMAGHNWARVLLMSFCALAALITFASIEFGREVVTITHLPTVAVSILVLLALSSHRARDYAIGRWEGA
ncbi:MAG: LssY C-terminal domain-containing protein [Ornithinimicrobium sp.]